MDSTREEDREVLLARYRDLQWTDDVADFRCNRCDRVLIRHYISNCGHKFCLNCKKLMDDGSRRWRCPLEECKKTIEHIHLQDVFFEETVFELRTHCPNHNYGCPFIGPLKDIAGHLRKCVDTRENALPVLLDRSKSLDSAFVIEQMAKLNEKIEARSSTLNQMQKSMEEERLVQDRKWAEQAKKWWENNRKWEEYDLKWKESDRKWEEQEDNNKRTNQLEVEMRQIMSQMSVEMSTLKEKWNETEVSKARVKDYPSPEQEVFNSVIKPELQHLRRVNDYCKEKADFTWIINNVHSLVNGSEKVFESEVFPLTGYPFGARAKVTLSGKYVQFYLSFKRLNQSIPEEEIEVKPLPRIYFTVKDQSEGKDRKDLIRKERFCFKNKFQFNGHYRIEEVDKSLLKSPVYTVDDKLAIAIHVEAPEVAQSVYSEDGTLTWAIDDFRKRKQAEVDDLIECHLSPYFYTDPKGHRMQVRAYLNGRGTYKNKGLGIFVHFLDGVHDEDLDDSFKYETTVTIVHPTQPTRSISKSEEHDYIFSKWFDMLSEAEIKSFLHNDTLYYKVEIVKTKIK